MSSKKGQTEPFVRCYEVGSPTLHQDGYTIYRVTQQIIQIDALERNIQESVTWKRYNDFKKLHKAMFSLHKALHRREEFPPFIKAQLFNRFEESVIEERRRTAQDLLNFVGQRNYLTSSVIFKQFFQDAQPVTRAELPGTEILKPSLTVLDVKPSSSSEGSHDELLVPQVADVTAGPAAELLPVVTASQDDVARADSPHSLSGDLTGDSNASALSGIWLHRQQADNLSSADDEYAFSEEDDPDAPLTSNVQQVESGCQLLARADIAVFDTLMSATSTDVRTLTCSNVELLSMLSADDDVLTPADMPQCDGMACDSVIGLCGHDEIDGIDMNDTLVAVADDGSVSATRPQTGCVIESGTGDLTTSPVHHTTTAGSAVQTVSLRNTQTAVIRSKLPSQQPWRSDASSLSSNEETRYIVEVAELISQAQEHEIAENYLASYSHYRSGIEILVKGVQKDSSMDRQHAVSLKISKYLLKADELYQTHLSGSDGEQTAWNRWDVDCETMVDAGVALLRAPSVALKNFRVIGVISNVLLVVDTATEGSFVIKVLCKSCRDLQQKSIVPTHLPYVVSLVRFYETDSAIYIQLQHAPGGRLWSYVGAYLNQCSDATANFEQRRPVDDSTVSAKKDHLRSDSSNVNLPVSADSIATTASASCAKSEELELKSKLSSDLDSVDESRYSIDRQISTTSSVECSSQGFGEVLQSTNSALKYFRIDSSDSSGHTSRQVSCSSAEDSFCRIHCVPLSLGGICRLCAESKTPQPASCSDNGTASPVETSIYDICHGNTVDNQTQELDRSCYHSLADEGTVQRPRAETNRSRHSTVRSNSQERCNSDSCSSRRRRRTLSSAFGELDLAESTCTSSTAPLRPLVHLPESCIQQWAAEMVVAISRLHSIGIICRDLRPANILLGDRGHILLTYFSQWNTVERCINDQAVDSLYCAPEVAAGICIVTPACDWWSVGALLYELLTGQSLQSCHPAGIFSHTTLVIPDCISPEAASLLRELLRYSPSERLGGGPGGSDDVRSHPFFSGIEWNNLLG